MTEASRSTNSSASSVATVVRLCFQLWSGSDRLRNLVYKSVHQCPSHGHSLVISIAIIACCDGMTLAYNY